MRFVCRIDEQGYFVEYIALSEGDPTPDDCTEATLPAGLLRARLVKGEWVEDATPEEIKELMKESETEPVQRKIEELDNACESAILTGFQSETTGHFYRFNRDDQMNFTQQMILMMANPAHTEVLWKTEDAGLILHSKDEFLAVVAEAEAHKRGCMQRFWGLKERAQAAETEEELNAIKWDVETDGTTAV